MNLELEGKLTILKENLVKTKGAVTAQNVFTRLLSLDDYEEGSGLNLKLEGKLTYFAENLVKTQCAESASSVFMRFSCQAPVVLNANYINYE